MTHEEILKLVQWLVSQDPDEKCRVCSQVYMAVHGQKSSSCRASHEGWRETAEKLYRELQSKNEI